MGGVIAWLGVVRAEDGYEDEEGFHTLASPATARMGMQSEQADPAGAGI